MRKWKFFTCENIEVKKKNLILRKHISENQVDSGELLLKPAFHLYWALGMGSLP